MLRETLLPLLVLGGSGCALTTKAEGLDVRYFSPEVPMVAPGKRSEQAKSPEVAASLRVGRISASSHLRKYIVYRPSAVEVRMHAEQWWAEAPEEYLRRALVDALFVEDALAQSLSSRSPTLDSELLAFEEIYEGDRRKARVSIRFALHDETKVLLAETVTVERPIRRGDDPAELARQIADALEAATDELAARVVKRLATLPPDETEEPDVTSADATSETPRRRPGSPRP